jgi:hypothetical protein
MVILWPAFLAAAALNALFFSLFDPKDLFLHGLPLEIEPLRSLPSALACALCFASSQAS